MKKQKAHIQQITTEIIDPQTGEIFESSTDTVKNFTVDVDSDAFFQIYIEHMAPLYKLTSPLQKNLLIKLCELAQFNTGVVLLPLGTRKDLCVEFNTTLGTLRHALKHLCDLGLIAIKDSIGILNPLIFWKGTKMQRDEVLRTGGYALTVIFKYP
jgi:hypothetical protein